jgi:hypothetical protein
MKTVFSLRAIFATIGFAQAGGFGGPPPFTNGSPLISGVDGSYQATARGKNLTGVFRFAYSGGRQSSNPTLPSGDSVEGLLVDPYNDYVFFVDGMSYRGMVQANVNTDAIAGVLDNGAANVPNFDLGDGLGMSSFMSGYFEGSMDQDSPYASMQGDGKVTVSGGMMLLEDTINNSDTTTTSNSTNGSTTVTVTVTDPVTGAVTTTTSTITDDSTSTSTSDNSHTAELQGTEATSSFSRSFKFSGVRASLTTGT